MAYNYYTLLGVSPSASSAEIKASYRNLAKRYHPDVCEAPRSKEAFQALNNAYKVLMHSDKRRSYDAVLDAMQLVNVREENRKAFATTMHKNRKARAYGTGMPIPSALPKLAVKILFCYGIFIGVLLVSFTLSMILSSYWSVWMGWLGFLGVVLVADGSQGLITNNSSYLLKVGNKLRKLYSPA